MITIKNLLKRGKVPKIKAHDRDYANMMREWFFGLFLGALVFFVGAVFLVFDFQKQMHAKDEEVTFERTEGNYRKNDVIQYAKIYNERAEKFESFFTRKGQGTGVESKSDISTRAENDAQKVTEPLKEKHTTTIDAPEASTTEAVNEEPAFQ